MWTGTYKRPIHFNEHFTRPPLLILNRKDKAANMKCIYVILLLAFAAVQAEDKYTTENDNLDIDAVVANDDTLKGFVGCFMDTATCDAVAADFKKDIPEAINTSCAKCTDAQKNIFHKFLAGLKQKLPSEYEAFKKKFDPENKHFTALETAVATY